MKAESQICKFDFIAIMEQTFLTHCNGAIVDIGAIL